MNCRSSNNTEDQQNKFDDEVKIITELFLKDAPEDMKQLYEQQQAKNRKTRKNTTKWGAKN